MSSSDILLLAPGPGMVFAAMPSGSVYVSDQWGLVHVTNGSTADQSALQAAGCYVLSPFFWATGFLTLGDLYAADLAAILPGITGFPRYTTANVYQDPSPSNNGTWIKTGAGNGSGQWTQVLNQVQMSQVKAALYAVSEATFLTVQSAVLASPFSAANQQWTSGGAVTVGGPIGAAIAAALTYSTGQMNILWASAAAQPF